MRTILETYPDANKALAVGSDDMLHFTDVWGESWCSSSFSVYFVSTLEYQLELFENVDDGPIDEFCPGCKEAADEEKDFKEED